MLQAQAALAPASALTPRRMARQMAGTGPVMAIIGAGYSGTMAAIHLCRLLPPDHSILLFDRTGRFARGPTYAATEAAHRSTCDPPI